MERIQYDFSDFVVKIYGLFFILYRWLGKFNTCSSVRELSLAANLEYDRETGPTVTVLPDVPEEEPEEQEEEAPHLPDVPLQVSDSSSPSPLILCNLKVCRIGLESMCLNN